jgi:hypothetical protein
VCHDARGSQVARHNLNESATAGRELAAGC